MLLGCVPTSSANTTQWFFSADAWGGVPFSPEEKQAAVVEALAGRRVNRLVRQVDFEVSPRLSVRRFVAVFEVDARRRPPTFKSGYDVSFVLPEIPPERVLLTNVDTGVAWTVNVGRDGQ